MQYQNGFILKWQYFFGTQRDGLHANRNEINVVNFNKNNCTDSNSPINR